MNYGERVSASINIRLEKNYDAGFDPYIVTFKQTEVTAF